MYNVNLSDNIREDICEEIMYLKNNYGQVDLYHIKDLINDMDYDNYNIINRYKMDDNIVVIRCTSDIFKRQMYTDYYRIINYKNILCNNEKRTMLKPSIKQIELLFNDTDFCSNMLHCMVMTYMCLKMDRILVNKCLNEEDVKYLNSINPFFKSEYDKYNINIDLKYIKKEIEYLKDEHKPNIEYLIMSDLIFNYYKIDKEETEKLLIELFNQNLGIITSDVIPSEYIKMGQIVLSKKNLALMLKDYYEYNQKKLKYKKDDKGEFE